jgi:hypothetical protein
MLYINPNLAIISELSENRKYELGANLNQRCDIETARPLKVVTQPTESVPVSNQMNWTLGVK